MTRLPRQAFLKEACAGDAARQARIENLLDSALEAEKFFAESGAALHLQAGLLPATDAAGTPTVPGE